MSIEVSVKWEGRTIERYMTARPVKREDYVYSARPCVEAVLPLDSVKHSILCSEAPRVWL